VDLRRSCLSNLHHAAFDDPCVFPEIISPLLWPQSLCSESDNTIVEEIDAEAWGDRIADLVAVGRYEEAIKALEELIAEIERRKAEIKGNGNLK